MKSSSICRAGNLALFVLFALCKAESAYSCSCIGSKETPNRVRAWAEDLFRHSQNIILVRATRVVSVGERHEQAELMVVRSWKGPYKRGSIVHSDTAGIGEGMCDSTILVGQLYLATFASEPFPITGCPDDFVLTDLENLYLNWGAHQKWPNNRIERTHEP